MKPHLPSRVVGFLATCLVGCTGSLPESGPTGGGSSGASSVSGSSSSVGAESSGANRGSSTGGSGVPGAGGNVSVGGNGATLPSGGASAGGGAFGAGAAPPASEAGRIGFSGPASQASALRKVKSVLTGLAPSDAELAQAVDSAGIRSLVDAWMQTPEFEEKMLFFFSNTFQQSSLALLDFEFQLRKRPGAFDLAYAIFGDNAFPLLFKNMKESFARTAFAIAAQGRPFTDVLTTNQFMMTTALKSLYMQIEAPYDIHTMTFKFNHGMRPALEDTLDPKSTNYMVFGYEAPTTSTVGRKFTDTCAGDATKVSVFPGNTYLFHILLGSVPRDSSNNGAATTQLGCMEHPSKPYFTAQDSSDWQLVTIGSGTPINPWDLPALRKSGATLNSKLPRVSFFSTPAFFSVWNTNDSNQHRVTANQALLAALGQGYTSTDANIPAPPTLTAVNGMHATTDSLCYACHKSLDPMRQFWGNFYDYNDKGEGKKSSGAASFGFSNVTQNGAGLADFGKFLAEVTDEQVAGSSLNRFGLHMTQQLCFFANSSKCEETDPEMRRVALAFQEAKFDFRVLVRELFSSPLVTAAGSTATFEKNGVTISIARRDQLCQALSNRLAKPDLCETSMPTPTDVTTAMNRLAGALPADAFSRGSENPVTPPEPNLFYRAASELVCEAIAVKVVDAASGSVFVSSDPAKSIDDMVSRVMGVPPSDPKHARSLEILTSHFNTTKTSGASATNALRSTFSAACQSPPSLALGI
jgi:hypothetical protein